MPVSRSSTRSALLDCTTITHVISTTSATALKRMMRSESAEKRLRPDLADRPKTPRAQASL
jgi:hypothetical protein